MKPIDLQSTSTPVEDQAALVEKMNQAVAAPQITSKQLSAQSFFEQGVTHAREERIDSPISAYSQAIHIDPQFARAYLYRGNVYASKGDFDKAIEDYSHAISLVADFSEAYYKRGFAYSNKGEFHRAIDDFHKTLELNPNHVRAGYMRSKIAKWILQE